MALFSYGSDKYRAKGSALNRAASLAKPKGQVGTFGGPIQFRPPGQQQSPAQLKEDLSITPNPAFKRAEGGMSQAEDMMTVGPRRPSPARPPQEKLAAAAVIPQKGPASPATVRPPAAPAPQQPGGFSAAAGSELAARVAAMGKAAEGTPDKVQTAQMPSQTPLSPITAASAGIAPPSPSAPANAQLAALRSRVVGALAPGEEEARLREQLTALQGATAQGVAGLEGQGRGIPLELIRGQQGLLQEQGLLQQQTLQGQLANVMAQRKLAQEAAQTELGFAEADIAKDEARAAAQAKGAQPIEIGDSLVALNPATGQYEVVYSSPEEVAAAKGFTLGEGQAYYDAEGNLVAERGKTFAPSRAGGGVGGGAGGAGMAGLSPLAKSIADNPGLMANLTPTEKGKVLRELAGAGVSMEAFGLSDLNAGQREKISLFDTLMGTAQGVGDLVEGGVSTGPIAGRFQAGARAVLGTGQKFGELQSLVANMNTTLLNLRSGAAVTPQEFERLSAFIPSPNDQESVIKQKITSFNSELQRAKEDFVSRATQPVSVIAGVGGGGAANTDFRAKYEY